MDANSQCPPTVQRRGFVLRNHSQEPFKTSQGNSIKKSTLIFEVGLTHEGRRNLASSSGTDGTNVAARMGTNKIILESDS